MRAILQKNHLGTDYRVSQKLGKISVYFITLLSIQGKFCNADHTSQKEQRA